VREGFTENPWEGLVGGLILGSAEYAQQLLKRVKRHRREEPARARLTGRVSWEQIVKAGWFLTQRTRRFDAEGRGGK